MFGGLGFVGLFRLVRDAPRRRLTTDGPPPIKRATVRNGNSNQQK